METRPLRIVQQSKTQWIIQVRKSLLWWSWWSTVSKSVGACQQLIVFSTLATAEEHAEVLRRRDFTPTVVREYEAIETRGSLSRNSTGP